MGKEKVDTNFSGYEPLSGEMKIRSGLDFEHWCRVNNVSNQAKNQIGKIRKSEPSRRVSSGKGSVSGVFPSRKMGVTIQFESHKNEFPFIYELEHDSNVLEYYDQPSVMKLVYQDRKGRGRGHNHTPDFFVIYDDSATWVECKTEEELIKLAIKSPNRYQLDDNNEWICPPGIEYAKQIGLNYELRSSKKINWTLLRNIEYLTDYFKISRLEIPENILYIISEIIKKEPAITLENLFEKTSTVATRDDVFSMIAFDEIYVDLRTDLIAEPEKVKVFINKETAEAYSNIIRTDQFSQSREIERKVNAVRMKANESIVWDSKVWKIVNVGEKNISLIDEFQTCNEIPLKIFEKLVMNESIQGVSKAESDNVDISSELSGADQQALKKANEKMAFVLAELSGDDEFLKKLPVDRRTLRRWVKAYQDSKKICKFGYLGLLPKNNIGNRKIKISDENKGLILGFISDRYETILQKNRTSVYQEYSEKCKELSIESASFKTFCEYVKKQDMEKQTLKRKGKRASYDHRKFYYELSMTTPRHGERPFHIAHIDHTELDIELVDSDTGVNLGRPTMTLLIDAFSRRILAVYLTLDPPSRRSNLMVLRECVRRFGRLPQILVADGGKDFSSVYFDSFLAMFEVTKKIRPPAEPRFGSVIERMFGTTNTMFINNLAGNTQMTKNVRQMTKSVNPKNHAVWDLATLYEYLCEFLYEIYDQKEHSTLSQSPREAFAQGLSKSGTRSHLLIPYNEDFKLMTLPSTPKGTARVNYDRGVKINRIYYWSDEFRNPELNKKNIPVKFDPWNMGVAYVYVNDKWRKCISGHYSTLSGRSEKEIEIIANEIKARHKDSGKRLEISADKIVSFLKSAEVTEKILLQRINDRESKKIRFQINNEPVTDFDAERSDDTDQSDNPENNVIQFPTDNSTEATEKSEKEYRIFDKF